MSGPRVLVFAREPRPGRTKTRLVPALGADGAARLHAAMTRHALEQACRAGLGPVELWSADPAQTPFLAEQARRHAVELRHQAAGDLGQRLQGALAEATADGSAALVIGTDCPALDAEALAAAGALLQQRDAVLGPAHDGGYVLLGVHAAPASLFEGIAWGTGTVGAATRERLAALGWSWDELAPRPDIDRPGDLDALDDAWGPWRRPAEGTASP